MTNDFVRARIRTLTIFCSLFLLTVQQVDAQISPRDTLSYRPAWNGRDAVIHRPGDKPYSLYHLERPYPKIRKQPHDLTNFYGLYSGMWIPTGRDRVLGSHPLFGMDFGQWINRFMWNFNLEFQLGATSNYYNVIYYGATTPSNRYGAVYVGVNFGYSLFTIKKSVFYLTAGIGGTGFTPVEGDDNHDELDINSFTRNVGVGVQHFSKKGNLVGVALLYNWVGYQNPGGTPMDGNAVTVRLTLGVFE
jgi:hypothetical protein